jgi:hypothetical protein
MGIWSSVDSNWKDGAACRGAVGIDAIFFPPVESDDALQLARKLYCNLCPVSEDCLNSAIINNDSGIRGGMSTAQRRALRRVRTRAKCPVCSSINLVTAGPSEVCIGCGASWRGDRRPDLPARGKSGTTVETVSFGKDTGTCL